MKKSSTASIPIALLSIFIQESDETHPLSMPKILSMLEDDGIVAVRQTVYRCIEILREYGYDIVYINSYKTKGYYLKHLFTSSEVLFLSNMLKESRALSDHDRDELLYKINGFMSKNEKVNLPERKDSGDETESLLDKIACILPAVHGLHPVEFQYYDISIYKKKKYRRNGMKYRLIPYALVPYQSRYYCIFYDPMHHDFTNYRLDKMDHIETDADITVDPVPFDLESYMQASFDMYHGTAETVTIEAEKSMASLLFDQFEMKNIIIQHIGEDKFTASIRTAVTPTLTAWLLMYYNRCTVLRPKSLKEQLKNIGMALIQQYDNEEVNNDGKQN